MRTTRATRTDSAIRGRPPRESQELLARLRRRIVNGELAPGARLPTRRELHHSFDLSASTVEHALQRLIRDGFLTTRGVHGTFVADPPPHRCRYGLAFLSREVSLFGRALLAAAAASREGLHLDFPVFYGIDGHTDVPDYRRLVYDLRAERLAGLIAMFDPTGLAETPVPAGHPEIPRVTIAGHPANPRVLRVTNDFDAMIAGALDHFFRTGRRRVAILFGAQYPEAWLTTLTGRIAAAGLTTRPAWLQAVEPAHPHWAVNALHAVFQGRGKARPDALLITDDHIVAQAARALQTLGIRTPRDVDVVAHCNYPVLPPVAVAVRWFGFDAGKLLAACVDVIDRSRAGAKAPRVTLIAPEWGTDRRQGAS